MSYGRKSVVEMDCRLTTLDTHSANSNTPLFWRWLPWTLIQPAAIHHCSGSDYPGHSFSQQQYTTVLAVTTEDTHSASSNTPLFWQWLPWTHIQPAAIHHCSGSDYRGYTFSQQQYTTVLAVTTVDTHSASSNTPLLWQWLPWTLIQPAAIHHCSGSDYRGYTFSQQQYTTVLAVTTVDTHSASSNTPLFWQWLPWTHIQPAAIHHCSGSDYRGYTFSQQQYTTALAVTTLDTHSASSNTPLFLHWFKHFTTIINWIIFASYIQQYTFSQYEFPPTVWFDRHPQSLCPYFPCFPYS